MALAADQLVMRLRPLLLGLNYSVKYRSPSIPLLWCRLSPNVFHKPNLIVQDFKIGCAQSFHSSKIIMAPVIAPGQDISSAVSEWIAKNDVMVFSKTTCPFCIKLKKTFKEKRIEFVSVELNTLGDDGPKIQEELLKQTGQKTVPNVFVRGKHIGESSRIPLTFKCH